VDVDIAAGHLLGLFWPGSAWAGGRDVKGAGRVRGASWQSATSESTA
jgi:hypothetical protein